MSKLAISVANISKLYKIGALKGPRTTPQDYVAHGFKSLFRRNGCATVPSSQHSTLTHESRNTIWALKDVSFEVGRGEVFGIIGRNGSGKSTLLKILSRITQPTRGTADLYGRVGSLLEVGTGFHPELTGRENIFLNGAILGMKIAEIQRKFDEIVAFAETAKFIDTPVKRYSSGMYVRLAFAVAAHLEPEILIVDEVLSVGDAPFQRKCLGKIEDIADEGRTVLFVSHNMPAVLSLCGKAILLDSGRAVHHGSAQEVVRSYRDALETRAIVPLNHRRDRAGDGSVRLMSVRVESADHGNVILSTSRLKLTLRYRSDLPLRRARFLVGVYADSDVGIFALNSDAVGGLPDVLPAEGSVTCLTDPLNLTPGRCYVNIQVLKGGVVSDYIQHATYFDVVADEVYGPGGMPARSWVLCVLPHKWSLAGEQTYGD